MAVWSDRGLQWDNVATIKEARYKKLIPVITKSSKNPKDTDSSCNIENINDSTIEIAQEFDGN